MNIIKLKDEIMPENMPQAQLFNKYLKGKYAYWIQMRYIVPFDFMRHEGYVACEEDLSKLLPKENGKLPKPYGAPCIDVYDKYIIQFVDQLETDRINNILEFRMKNRYVTDADITIEEIKKFRTWLATNILYMDQTETGIQKYIKLNETVTHILQYYKGGMYDNTIKILSEFGSLNLPQSVSKSCGCSNISDLILSQPTNICDPIKIYKENIYKNMVTIFSDIDFWTQWPKEFIWEFKKYIDNIIKLNLPLVDNTFNNNFVDCGCMDNDNQSKNMDILKKLSKSLEYIYLNDIYGHKNYISDSLREWSSLLYEIMEW